MYIAIGEEEYHVITNLSFAPSADLAGTSIPIDEFQADIHTDDDYSEWRAAALYDDNDTLFAGGYQIIYAEKQDIGIVRIRARSDVALLDRFTLPAVYYNGADIEEVLDETIVNADDTIPGLYAPWPYTLDNSLKNKTITGFCPEQTARDRLLWIVFVIGGYIKTSFNSHIHILPIDTTATMVPKGDTYWKPTVSYKDAVTAIKVKSYSFTRGEPSSTDKWVTDGTYDYIVTEQENTLSNPDTPTGTLVNVKEINGVYLVNSSNVSGILTFLAQWYFNRQEVNADIINNAAYAPGDKIQLHVDDETMVSGFIDRETFAFGQQAKATIHLAASEDVETANLTIFYKYGDMQLDRKEYLMPVGYSYCITNPYIDFAMNGHWYVFYPEAEAATGTITSGTNESTQTYDVALDLHEGILHVISVDSVTDNDGIEVIT